MPTATHSLHQMRRLNDMDVGRKLMLIEGQWVESIEAQFISVENPSRGGTAAGEVPRGGAADVDRAVRAAARAFEEWRRVSPRERGRLMIKIGEAIEVRANEIARTIALETGTAIRTQSRPEAMLTEA